VFDVLKRAFDGGRDELSRDNLLRMVVDRIVGLREYGRHGEHALPPEVAVTVTAPAERVEVVRAFVTDAGFDREVEDELVNRLTGVARDALPLRLYAVEAGEPVAVAAVGQRSGLAVRLKVQGGDRDGTVLVVVPGQRLVRLGRGLWHGPDQQERNDLVVSQSDSFVSRRAGRLRRVGAAWEVEALDQADCLVVVRPDGSRTRPHHTPDRWVAVRSGDAIELSDGSERVITVGIEVSVER
jgi:hypothetical protein